MNRRSFTKVVALLPFVGLLLKTAKVEARLVRANNGESTTEDRNDYNGPAWKWARRYDRLAEEMVDPAFRAALYNAWVRTSAPYTTQDPKPGFSCLTLSIFIWQMDIGKALLTGRVRGLNHGPCDKALRKPILERLGKMETWREAYFVQRRRVTGLTAGDKK